MESLTSGTIAGTGSFRCQRCGYVLTLTSVDTLGDCPGCGGRAFTRASLFNAGGYDREEAPTREAQAAVEPKQEWLLEARAALRAPGEYVLYEDGQDIKAVALTREWIRIGRSLAADVRFDDPTVSRRHALVVRQADGVRVLDDRSLNGVFVNGERIEWRALEDGDEIVVGRYKLTFVSLRAADAVAEPDAPVHAVG